MISLTLLSHSCRAIPKFIPSNRPWDPTRLRRPQIRPRETPPRSNKPRGSVSADLWDSLRVGRRRLREEGPSGRGVCHGRGIPASASTYAISFCVPHFHLVTILCHHLFFSRTNSPSWIPYSTSTPCIGYASIGQRPNRNSTARFT